MSLNRYATKRDANEPEIVEAFRKAGATVEITDKPVDLIVGYRGLTLLVEVKQPAGPRGGTSGRELTPSQQTFCAAWKGRPVAIVRTVEDALRLLGAVDRAS